jgi:hypothetical protein
MPTPTPTLTSRQISVQLEQDDVDLALAIGPTLCAWKKYNRMTNGYPRELHSDKESSAVDVVFLVCRLTGAYAGGIDHLCPSAQVKPSADHACLP